MVSSGRKKKRLLFICAVVVVITLLTITTSVFRNFADLRSVRAQIAEAETQLTTIEENNEALQEKIDYSKTDSFVERKARELLGWVYPDEYYILGEK